jgi:hypothetical protein
VKELRMSVDKIINVLGILALLNLVLLVLKGLL